MPVGGSAMKRTNASRQKKQVQLPSMDPAITALLRTFQDAWKATGVSRERLIDFFRRLDRNGNGSIDFEEFVEGIRSTAPALGSMDLGQLASLFEGTQGAGGEGAEGFQYAQMVDFMFTKPPPEPALSSPPPVETAGCEFQHLLEGILDNVKHRPYNQAITQDQSLKDSLKASPWSPRTRTFLTNTDYLSFSTTKRPKMALKQPSNPVLLPPVSQPPIPPTPPPQKPFDDGRPAWRFQRQPSVPALKLQHRPPQRPSPRASTERKIRPSQLGGPQRQLSARYVGFVNGLMDHEAD